MGRPLPAEDVCLICGMLSAFPALLDRAAAALIERFGPVSCESETLPFDFTTYYEAEMGKGILRRFLAFERPFKPDKIVEAKLWTNHLEERLAVAGFPSPRPINLDPGYLASSKLVLATTKDNSHRVYLGDGIYGETTLTYAGKNWQPMPWTYPDYRSGPYLRFFAQARAGWLARRRPDAPQGRT